MAPDVWRPTEAVGIAMRLARAMLHHEIEVGERLQPPGDHAHWRLHGLHPLEGGMINPEEEGLVQQEIPELPDEVDGGKELPLGGLVVPLRLGQFGGAIAYHSFQPLLILGQDGTDGGMILGPVRVKDEHSRIGAKVGEGQDGRLHQAPLQQRHGVTELLGGGELGSVALAVLGQHGSDGVGYLLVVTYELPIVVHFSQEGADLRACCRNWPVDHDLYVLWVRPDAGLADLVSQVLDAFLKQGTLLRLELKASTPVGFEDGGEVIQVALWRRRMDDGVVQIR